MIHEMIPVGALQCNCSVIGDETTREGMVIDPGDEIREILALVERHRLTIRQIVDQVGYSYGTIQRLLNENDVVMRAGGRRNRAAPDK